jgi:hypothetical protein
MFVDENAVVCVRSSSQGRRSREEYSASIKRGESALISNLPN